VPYISNAVEYALHCLLYLVSSPGESIDASTRDLAELQGVSAEYLAKIFTKLHRAGLVAGTEGIGGGFALARAAEKISVLEVIVAIDGKKPLFDCRNIRLGCAVFGSSVPRWASKGVCSIHAVMLQAEARMRTELASHSLADLMGRVAAKAPPDFAIDISTWLGERSANRRGTSQKTPRGRIGRKAPDSAIS
jgi:Rrf2 family protein